MNQGYPSSTEPKPPSYRDTGESAQPHSVPIRAAVSVPLVTYIFMGVNILVFLLQLASQFIFSVDYPVAVGVKANELIVQGQFWRLFTPMFLHGSILHLAFNMYALFVFGQSLERYFGHGRFLALYFLSGFAGNVFSFIFSSAPSLGSSTAIFGILGAEGVFLYQNRSVLGRVGQRALMNLITIAVINFIIGLSPGIDNWGHLGGLIGGAIFTWFAGPLLQVEGIYPALAVVDGRQTNEVILAGMGDFILFFMLAGIKIYFQGGFNL